MGGNKIPISRTILINSLRSSSEFYSNAYAIMREIL